MEKDQSTGQYYLIPSSLDLSGLPHKVINSYLDRLNQFPEERRIIRPVAR